MAQPPTITVASEVENSSKSLNVSVPPMPPAEELTTASLEISPPLGISPATTSAPSIDSNYNGTGMVVDMTASPANSSAAPEIPKISILPATAEQGASTNILATTLPAPPAIPQPPPPATEKSGPAPPPARVHHFSAAGRAAAKANSQNISASSASSAAMSDQYTSSRQWTIPTIHVEQSTSPIMTGSLQLLQQTAASHSQTSELVGNTTYFASACEKSLQKLQRWNHKLTRPGATEVYGLANKSECQVVSHKFLTMLATVRTAIEHEWIEEELAHSDLTDQQLAKQTRFCQMPAGTVGKQRALDSRFEITKIQIAKSMKVGNDDIPLRFCAYCEGAIFNRGWTLNSELKSGQPLDPQKNHVCNSCYSVGLETRRVTMTERVSVHDIISLFREGINVYNSVLSPLCQDVDINLGLFITGPNKKIIDDFLSTDPRPADGRSDASIAYHLFIRMIDGHPDIFCHQCKNRKPSYQIIGCSDRAHLARIQESSTNLMKSGFYYCLRCCYNRYREKALDSFANREWKCYACRGSCNCAACSDLPKKERRASGRSTRAQSDDGGSEVSGTTGRSGSATNTHNAYPLAPVPFVRGKVGRPRNSERAAAAEAARRALEANGTKVTVLAPPAAVMSTVKAPPQKRIRTSTRIQHKDTSGVYDESKDDDDMNEDYSPPPGMQEPAIDYQRKYFQQTAATDRLNKEVKTLQDQLELYRKQPAGQSSDNVEIIQVKTELLAAQKEIKDLQTKVQQMEEHKAQTATVVQNLKKIARAVATQAAQLGKDIIDPATNNSSNVQ